MRHILFDGTGHLSTAILIKSTSFKQEALIEHYVKPMDQQGIPPNRFIAFDLKYNEHNKAPVSVQNSYLESLLPALDSLGVTTLYVCDAAYFKNLTKVSKAEPNFGYVLPCQTKGYEHMNVVLGLNHSALFYNPTQQDKLDISLKALCDHLQGTHTAPGADIIHSAYYPQSVEEIASWLDTLHLHETLTCDIEAFSLKFYEAGIGTIGFAWDEHNGGAFAVDYRNIWNPDGSHNPCELDIAAYAGFQSHNHNVKMLFRMFLERYQGTLIWHNAAYDTKVIIYELWMDHPHDYEGMLKGIEIMTRRVHDTQIISYLATNSCAGNKLGLKDQSQEYSGNYAQDNIKDIRKIPLADLLQYNLIDCLSTWYVYQKNTPIMVRDQQQEIYEELMLKSVPLLLQMELTGIPLNMETVKQTNKDLEVIRKGFFQTIMQAPEVAHFIKYHRLELLVTDYEARKAKAKNPSKIKKKEKDAFDHVEFNPNSNPQVQKLLYTVLQYPVLDLTDTKQPAVGQKTLAKLLVRAKNDSHKALLEALIGFAEVDKILNTFIAAFYENSVSIDGWHYLFGNYRLGGTVSGRLSSNSPNLMNIPATGSKYAKHIKRCFEAARGWLFVGADFNSLEDRISALTTRDPNKLKVYTDGYDGHCLRAFRYFPDRLPGIVNTVASINSIEYKFKSVRQDSKAPTFLLTYGGTYHGLMNNLGMSLEEAKKIEKNYHDLYAASDAWVQDKIQQASKDGYVTTAFGLRVRTPLLKQVIIGNKKTPYEAQAEARTAANSLGQGWGMLNNRAGIEFRERTLASKYRTDILPVAHIHDAQYFMVRDELAPVHWMNKHLVECMQWQQDPAIAHPTVKLGGNLGIFFPDWSVEITLPNNATPSEINQLCEPHSLKNSA